MNTSDTRRLPSLPSLPKASAVPQRCSCGCGGLTKGGRFVPGHDAKLLAMRVRVERGICTLQQIADICGEGCAAATADALEMEWPVEAVEEK